MILGTVHWVSFGYIGGSPTVMAALSGCDSGTATTIGKLITYVVILVGIFVYSHRVAARRDTS